MRKHLNQSTVKTLKHILWAFLTTTVLAGCSDDLTYTSGTEDDPDNYGVYFPEQTSPTEVERDPAEEATVTYKVRRAKYLDAITVPVAVTASKEGIFEIEPIRRPNSRSPSPKPRRARNIRATSASKTPATSRCTAPTRPASHSRSSARAGSS